MRTLIAAAFVSALALAGCTDVEPPQTASGRPEVTIAHASPDKVKGTIISLMLDKGYRLDHDSPYELVFAKQTDNLAAAVLLSTKMGGLPDVRVTYTIAEIGVGTRVVAGMEVVSNPGTGFESKLDMSRGAESGNVQAFLTDIAHKFDASEKPMPPQSNKKPSHVASR